MIAHGNTSHIPTENRFQPGHKPVNHGGRPGRKRGYISLDARLNKYLKCKTPCNLPDGTRQDIEMVDAIILKLLYKASIKGDLAAIKEVLDRAFGKVTDRVQVMGHDGGALEVNHTHTLQSAWDSISQVYDLDAQVEPVAPYVMEELPEGVVD